MPITARTSPTINTAVAPNTINTPITIRTAATSANVIFSAEKPFSHMLKYFRIRENLSQNELAEKLGLSSSTISMYEVGKREPDFETEEKIADFFNTDLNTLRGKDVEHESYYLNEDAKEAAQFLFENPEYKVLFDATRKVKKDDILFVKEIID